MSTTNRQRLPERAESLLAGWPAPGKSALEWEAAADRTIQMLRDATQEPREGALADDALFAAPLPAEPGEGTEAPGANLPAAAASADTEEPGLLSIARKVKAQTEGASPKEIALAGLRAVEAERGDAPLAPSPVRPPTRAEMDASSVAGLMGRVRTESRAPKPAPVHAGAPHVAVEAAAHSELPAPLPKEKKSKRGAFAALGAVGLSLAAAFALYAGARMPKEAASSAPLITAQEPVAPAASVAAHAAAEPAVAPARIDEAAQAAPVSKLDSLPKAASAARAKSAVPLPKPAPVESKKAAPAGPGGKNSLNDALNERYEPPAKSKAPPQEVATAGETLNEHPSVGDVQVAAAQVSMKARMCLAGQEEKSQAQLVFGSDGRVKSVVISGPAAGTPAEGCLKAALMGARVPPFSDKSYSFSMPVRPP